MGTSRLNNRDRLFIRIARDGTAIANSAIWRKQIPRGSGRWKDITSAVLGCCSSSEPTENSYLVVRIQSALDSGSDVTGIEFPGYSWTGSIQDTGILVVPLPYDFNETITFTTATTAVAMSYITGVLYGDGVITPSGGSVPISGTPSTFTVSVTSTPGSQYQVILGDD